MRDICIRDTISFTFVATRHLLVQNLRFHISLAFKALSQNRQRSALTITIIALGLWALIGILTCIEVLKSSIQTNFTSLGVTTFQITRKTITSNKDRHQRRQTNINSTITYPQAQSFKKQYKFPALVGVSMQGSMSARVRYGDKETNPNISVMGIDEAYLTISNTELAGGRNFSDQELYFGNYACILGYGIAQKLFRNKPLEAIGQSITIGNLKYKVVGVAASKEGSMLMNADNMVLIPLQNARKVYGSDRNFVISVMAKDVYQREMAASEAEGLFRVIRKIPIGDESDFMVDVNDNLAEDLLQIVGYIGWAALIIGIITLLGSIVGLMNIMLVSVVERTREIGLSKAIGAKASVIKNQFLTEALLISLLGGALGILTGILTGNLLGLIFHTGFIIPWLWIGLGVALCTIVGLFSGYYPALQASKLDPIHALRYE
jgi:putative ABC transport system permease protein